MFFCSSLARYCRTARLIRSQTVEVRKREEIQTTYAFKKTVEGNVVSKGTVFASFFAPLHVNGPIESPLKF